MNPSYRQRTPMQAGLDGLREIAHQGKNANLVWAFEYMGWSLERKQKVLF